ncbi:MAG: hypothetical protein JNM63_17960 [Spirochaetia bacterium]|nr:hypothetical protein [Spirochaetia bacterium]
MDALIQDFERDGFVAIRGAFGGETLRECVSVIEKEWLTQGLDSQNPATWTKPVVRINCPDGPAFKAAGGSQKIRSAYDAFLGKDGWETHQGVGGTNPSKKPFCLVKGPKTCPVEEIMIESLGSHK